MDGIINKDLLNQHELPNIKIKVSSGFHSQGWFKGLAKRSQHFNAKDVATCFARCGQTHATFSSFSTQHVNVHVPQALGAQEVDLTRMP